MLSLNDMVVVVVKTFHLRLFSKMLRISKKRSIESVCVTVDSFTFAVQDIRMLVSTLEKTCC